MGKPGPLLRLVHSLERRRAGWPFNIHMTLRRSDGIAVGSFRHSWQGPRAFVVGAGARVDIALPENDSAALMPRHVAIVAVPRPEGVLLRVFSLHPERGLRLDSVDGDSPSGGDANPHPTGEFTTPVYGGALARSALRLWFDSYCLDVEAVIDGPQAPDRRTVLETYPIGQQLSFFAGASIRNVGDAIASVAGPAGGAAVPALVHSADDRPGVGGTLVLRSRNGVHRAEVASEELKRGLLIGRSRRCVLGRGFDENDGLSRVHALVIGLEEGVFALDLASRYGLRDVSRPNRLISTSRLDDGVGCLVYGAGYLTFGS